MTVKLLQDWYDTETQRQYRGGNLLTKDANTEAGLIALKMADANLTGGTAYQAPVVSRNLNPPAALALDPATGAPVGLVGPSGSDFIVVSEDAPSDADGRPDGTIYIQTA